MPRIIPPSTTAQQMAQAFYDVQRMYMHGWAFPSADATPAVTSGGCLGSWANNTISALALTYTSTTSGPYIEIASDTTAGLTRGIRDGTVSGVYGANPAIDVKAAVDSIAAIRTWSGLANGPLAAAGVDDPAVDHVLFQFSTSRADTNWMLSRKAGGSQVLVDTGVAAAAGVPLHFIMEVVDGTLTAEIQSVDLTSLWTSGPLTADVPASGTAFQQQVGLAPTTTTRKRLRFYQATARQRAGAA